MLRSFDIFHYKVIKNRTLELLYHDEFSCLIPLNLNSVIFTLFVLICNRI